MSFEELLGLFPVSLAGGRLVGYAAQLRKSAEYGEDTLAFGMEPCAFVGVFDGHGGDSAARLAAAEMSALMREHAGDAAKCFASLDARVTDKSGTTALVASLEGDTLALWSLGDCVAVAFPQQRVLSREHSCRVAQEQQRLRAVPGVRFLEAADQFDASRSSEYQAWLQGDAKIECVAPAHVREAIGVPGHRSCAVTRSIGDVAFGPLLSCVPEVVRVPARDVELLALGSDGFWDQVNVEQVSASLAAHGTHKAGLKAAIKHVTRLAFDGWGGARAARDDITVALIQVH